MKKIEKANHLATVFLMKNKVKTTMRTGEQLCASTLREEA